MEGASSTPPTGHDAYASLPLFRLGVDPLIHAAHPDTRHCPSLECLRAHCLHLETTRTTEDVVCTPTSPFSGSPVSTRSGTSPGYANDWATRQEKLVIEANVPTKERIDRTVKTLAPATLNTKASTTSSPSEPVQSDSASTPSAASSSSPSASVLAHSVLAAPLAQSKLLQRRQQRRQQAAVAQATAAIEQTSAATGSNAEQKT